MNSPLSQIQDPDFLKLIQKASVHVEDILYGRKTIGEVVQIPLEDAEITFKKAQTALKLEDFKGAAEMFQAVLVVNHRDQRALLGLAGALEGLKQYGLALVAYAGIMTANFQDPVAPFRAGVCLMKMDKHDEAGQMFRLAAECRQAVTSPAKLAYVERAENMIRALDKE